MPVEAQVRYLNPEWRGRAEIPEIGDRESRRANTRKHPVTIHDARPKLEGGALSLDVNGFSLLKHRSSLKDFHDDGQVRSVYYGEMEALAKRVTGAAEVFFTGHQVRTEDRSDFNKAYARFVHCDYALGTPRQTSLRAIERRGLEPADYADCEFAWYNSWQPFDHAVARNPLAVIDAASLAPDDILDYRYTGYRGKRRPDPLAPDPGLSALPVQNPDHRFYYVANMATDELLLIKQLDTRPDRAVACPHTSFDDPASPEAAPPRRSIEVRMMAVFR